jgi:hypothetical protein
MAHRREVLPSTELDGDDLTRAMVGIGINLAASPVEHPNIEDVLLFASREAMDRADLRVFGLLVQWLEMHLARVNADRLIRLVTRMGSERVMAFWSALASAMTTDRRLSRLLDLHGGARVDVVETGTEFQVARYGEDSLFEGTALRVAGNLIRRRPADVLSPSALAGRHRGYHYRVLIGPSYRADMWAELEREPSLTPSELARRTYGSFATAWAVHRDFAILEGVDSGQGSGRQVA